MVLVTVNHLENLAKLQNKIKSKIIIINTFDRMRMETGFEELKLELPFTLIKDK